MSVITTANKDRYDIVIDGLKEVSAQESKTVLMKEVGLSFSKQNSSQDHLWTWICWQSVKGAFQNHEEGSCIHRKCEECFLPNWPTQNRKQHFLIR